MSIVGLVSSTNISNAVQNILQEHQKETKKILEKNKFGMIAIVGIAIIGIIFLVKKVSK
jgi:hypothetical protein